MDYKDVHKLIKFTKGFAEYQKILRQVLLDYVSVKENNKKLVEINLALLEDVNELENLLSQTETEDLVIH